MTGKEYYDYWHGEQNKIYWSPSDHSSFIRPNLHEGHEQYQTDTKGHWFDAQCASHVPTSESTAYFRAHPPVYITPGVPAPAVDEGLDPAFLAQVAFEYMELPEGTIRWNPSLDGSGATLVNMDTFVWVENAATEVQVTASVPGVSSTVTARMTRMTLEADGADDSSCPDAGTPYSTGMKKSSCTIVFYRSSANQPVKDGQSLPTATLTATARWEATWTSSLNATPRELDSQELTTTAEIPVAEVQTIVTH